MYFRIHGLAQGCAHFTLCSSKSSCAVCSFLCNFSTFIPINQSLLTSSQSGLYWFVGIGTLVQAAVHCETRDISENPFSPRDFYDIVKQHKITIVASSPSHIPLCLASPQALAASDLSSLRSSAIVGCEVATWVTSTMKDNSLLLIVVRTL